MTSLPHIIACPVCQDSLHQESKRWLCPNQHSFDIARHGYVNLLLAQHKKSKMPGDNKEMVDARLRVLNSQLYQPISDWLNQWIIDLLIEQSGTLHIADVGCGEGYYTARLGNALQDHLLEHQLYGVDISKDALRNAAKRSKDIHWLVASGGQLPFLANQLDLIVCLFTNLMPQGFAKALKPGAAVVLLNTGENHLFELRDIIYPEVRKHAFDPTAQMQEHGYRLSGEHRLNFKAQLKSQQQILDLLQMTPHWWRTSEAALERLKQYDTLDISIDITLHQFNYQGETAT